MDEPYATRLWRFVRGDLPVAEFEAWAHSDKGLEAVLGGALHWHVASTDYRSAEAVCSVRDQLRAILEPHLNCQCPPIPDLGIIPMGMDGLDQRFFTTVKEVRSHGRELWWLYLSRCAVCGQDWMVAQEERIFDDYLVRRLSRSEVDAIVTDDSWPDDFFTYERVLEIARRLGRTESGFVDRRSPALIESVRDLKRDRAGITAGEIARLLGIEEAHAADLMKIM